MRRQAAVFDTCRAASRRRFLGTTRETRGKSTNTLSADLPDIDLGYRRRHTFGEAHTQFEAAAVARRSIRRELLKEPHPIIEHQHPVYA
jgi:hypothetical protein